MQEPLAGPAETTPEPATGNRTETEYHVLRLTGSAGADESYKVEARNVTAANAKDAIRKSVTPNDTPTSFVAIPSRSFKLHTISVKMTAQTIIE